MIIAEIDLNENRCFHQYLSMNTISNYLKIKNLASKSSQTLAGLNFQNNYQAKRKAVQSTAFLFAWYQFTKVGQHFYELQAKTSKGFKNTKWLSHFVFWD